MFSPSNYLTETNRINWVVIGLLSLILAISPIMALVFALLFYRRWWAFLLFIVFAFYFGWFYEPQLDLLNHYEHFKSLIGKSLGEVINDSGTRFAGSEPYPVLFKYMVGQISANPHFFSACACTVYAVIFSYGVLGSIRDLYVQKKTLPAWLLLLGIIFIVEYNWFLGLRYWSGAFIFIAFYVRYARTSEIKYLLLSFLCICFHFSLLVLCAAAILNHVLKENFKIRYFLVLIGWGIRYLQIPILTYMAKLDIMEGIVKEESRNESIIKSVAKRMEYFRTEGNIAYLIRNDILFLGACIALIFLWRKYRDKIFYTNSILWGEILILYAIGNIGYVDLIFYERFYKLTLLLLYIYLFIILMQVQLQFNANTRLCLSLFIGVPVIYGIATIAVSQRDYLWNIQLWFNNFIF